MANTQQQQPTSAQQKSDRSDENESLWNLRMELGDDAELLKYLPYHRTTFQTQNELAGAAAERLLYGDMMEEKDQLWIYFTLFGGGPVNSTGGNRMITFHTLKGAQNGDPPLSPGKVKEIALASQPFKAAVDYWEVVAIAKYYFIKRGTGFMKLKNPVSAAPFRDDLIRSCKDYKAAYEAQQGKAKTHGIATDAARQSAPATPSNRAPSTAPTGPRAEMRASAANTYAPATPLPASSIGKRTRSPVTHREPSRAPSPFLSSALTLYSNHAPDSSTSIAAHEAMVDEYIALQSKEDDFDDRITLVERTRLDVIERLAALQTELQGADRNRDELMREKAGVRAAKKRLQATLKLDDHFDVGFEAGVKMERKRLRRA